MCTRQEASSPLLLRETPSVPAPAHLLARHRLVGHGVEEGVERGAALAQRLALRRDQGLLGAVELFRCSLFRCRSEQRSRAAALPSHGRAPGTPHPRTLVVIFLAARLAARSSASCR